MEVSLQFAKLAVNVPNAKFIYIDGGDFCNGPQEQDRFVNSTTITETVGNFCLLSPDKQVDYSTRGESKKSRSRSLTETTPIANKNLNL